MRTIKKFQNTLIYPEVTHRTNPARIPLGIGIAVSHEKYEALLILNQAVCPLMVKIGA